MDELEETQEKIIYQSVEKEMKTSYIDYAMSVIVGRALPDVRDGLKPVHRRILYAMNDMGISSSKPYKKSARVVGEVLGKYHPHSDVAIYDTLVRMAQNFSLRYPLIDGQGNFGSIDGDNAAAMRYTECRMDKIAEEMLADIDKKTVDFIDNFDSSLKEPTTLPAKLPNLLVNGSSGIAVGMATNIPPHNLNEIVDGIILVIENEAVDIRELMEVVKAPDFPTGGKIYGIAGVHEAYATGKGKIRLRAKTNIEEHNNRKRIVVTEIPYQVNKSTLIETIAKLVRDRRIEGITDLRDESDREGMRIIIELRRDVMEDIVLNQLFKHTQMEVTFGVINLALVDNEPKILTLKETIQHYIDYRFLIIKNRTQYEMDKAKARAHILEGLIVALDNIDLIITLIRRAKSGEEAKNSLMSKFDLSERQAKAILEMQLQRLTNMERQKIKDEHAQTKERIARLEEILGSKEEILDIIKKEIRELKEKYGDERRTEIIEHAEDIEIEDLIPVEDVIVTITHTGYIKRLPSDTYRQQKRGGIGLIGMETKEEDRIVDLFITSTHNFILFFTNKGKVYWLKAYRIPVGGRHAKGRPIVNLLPRLEKGEKIVDTIPVKDFDPEQYLIFATKRGIVKKTKLSAYSRPMVSGIWAIKLKKGDELMDTRLSDGSSEVILATKDGKAARFDETEVRPTGRHTMGVIGIRLKGNDNVVSMTAAKEESILLSITENGYGKRSRISSYRKTRRGAQGVITIKTGKRNGKVVSVKDVTKIDELIIMSLHGMMIRIPVEGINIQGRATMGVRIMRLKKKDRVIAVTRLFRKEDEEQVMIEAERN
jgi:DNA gyrase subunit A